MALTSIARPEVLLPPSASSTTADGTSQHQYRNTVSSRPTASAPEASPPNGLNHVRLGVTACGPAVPAKTLNSATTVNIAKITKQAPRSTVCTRDD